LFFFSGKKNQKPRGAKNSLIDMSFSWAFLLLARLFVFHHPGFRSFERENQAINCSDNLAPQNFYLIGLKLFSIPNTPTLGIIFSRQKSSPLGLGAAVII
jgi:hypothetical protein